ncbi:serine hydrolase domain-containing protein [Chitinophaga sp. CF418]|uniref:serine hydrolase domain-containing protein n=1 Tax=Chitinophaga sp. CF418 TaxID=1855287 RepID=UPI0009143AC2|nr:serine hydrolase domain-containing protein [Chitinophaga sp. CF418]SHN13203.1 CubicO group peptidase, beta-lactamase class C family [Chitinophaga sp. CF418]
MRLIFFLSAIMLSGIFSKAQNRLGKLNIYFNNISREEDMNGNILLAENGRPVYLRSFGYSDFPSASENDINVRYNLASISKIFTSTAILQLKEKGRLHLEDTFQHYFPAFPYPGITIRHLLTHTSGLPDLELYEPLVQQFPDTIITNDIIISTLIKENKPLYFHPGEKYSYCNMNYSLLAMLVEKLSGLSFSDYLQTYIFQPARMLLTYCVKTSYQQSQGGIATPHVKATFYDTAYSPAFQVKRYRYTGYNNSSPTGASNIITNTSDLQLFDRAFFDGKLLSPASIEEALTPVRLNNGEIYWEHMDTMLGEGKGSYGLGWEIFEQPGFGKSVGHGGFMFGLATFYFRNLDKKQTIIAFDNVAGPTFGNVVTSAFYIMNNQPPMELKMKASLVRLFARTMVQYGVDDAVTCLTAFKSDTGKYYLSEREMNQLGYEFLYFSSFPDHLQFAIETFKINMLLFPESYNTYDSYAEALSKAGKKQEAILMYQKSIALNPDNQGGIKALKQLLSQL